MAGPIPKAKGEWEPIMTTRSDRAGFLLGPSILMALYLLQ